MNRLFSVYGSLFAILFLIAGNSVSLHAVPIVDQDSLYSSKSFANPGYSGNQIAQTFTVGSAGLLSQIDLQLFRYPEATTSPVVQIRSTTGGIPNSSSSSVLFETTVNLANVPLDPGFSGYVQPTSFDVSSAGIMVNPGDVLAISYTGPTMISPDWTLWSGKYGTNNYANGSRYYRSSNSQSWSLTGEEMSFRTWVDPNPLPPGPGIGNYTLFETALATPDHPSSNSGSIISSDFYTGIGFNVERTTDISQVGAYLDGTGTVFAAIIKLSGQYDVPNFSGNDVLGHALITLPNSTTGSDISADLDLTLEPGSYALVFGSGRFGATGEAFVRNSHIPNGNWTEYTLRQSDGVRTFVAGTKRMFVVADSAPDTLQIRPTLDLVAEIASDESMRLIDGEDDILVRNGATSSDPDYVALFQFSLADVPADREITGVKLEIDLNLLTFSGSGVAFDLFGYAADGTPLRSHAITLGKTDIGTTNFSSTGLATVTLDPTFVESLIGNSTHFGLAIAPTGTNNFRFATLEGGEFSEPALLTISLGPPPLVSGDFDNDGDVDGRDFLAWQRGESPNPFSSGDLAEWHVNYDNSELNASSAAVPEPSALLLSFCAITLFVVRRQ